MKGRLKGKIRGIYNPNRIRTSLKFNEDTWMNFKELCKITHQVPSWRIEQFMESEILLNRRYINNV